jgi:general secretion pathway protein C
MGGGSECESLHDNPHMTARWVAFLTWAAVASGALYWALRLAVSAEGVPAHAQVVSVSARAAGDLQRLLGAGAPAAQAAQDTAPAPAPTDPRFTLIGVVAPRPGTPAREGVALIAVDDQPAKAYRVGAVVEGSLVLLSVTARGASLGPRRGPASVVLELPEVPAASTGVPDDASAGNPEGGMPQSAPTPAPGRAPRPPAALGARPMLPVPAVVPGMPAPGAAPSPGGAPPPAGIR